MAEGQASEFEEIEESSWYRRRTLEFFRGFEDPFFNITANVDVTDLRGLCREESLSFAISALYFSQRALNSIDEFRIRIVNEKLVKFELVEATQTILLVDGSFAFCYFPHCRRLAEFNRTGRAQVEKYKGLATYDVERSRQDLVYYSVIPWVSFTSFKHASRMIREQTVPRIVFGKVFEQEGRQRMPVSVEGNHAVMDGIHIGTYFERLQAELDACSEEFRRI